MAIKSIVTITDIYKKSKKVNKRNKPTIIIPKKNVKTAVRRNKIRRQIRAILMQNKKKSNFIVKYFGKDSTPKFEDLKESVMKCLENNL